MIILGIDPGSRLTGYGVLEVEDGKERLVDYGVLQLNTQDSHQLRLKHIFERITALIERFPPDECAVEMPVYGRNPQSMLKLGRAQAAAMLAVLLREVPVREYTPKEVKRAVTGNGNAAKEQVWFMVKSILTIDESDPARGRLGLDASDALAVALCHAYRFKHGAAKPHKDWSSFLRDHPERFR
jgi:crossover junction endodeoxyribonuclease RuvC